MKHCNVRCKILRKINITKYNDRFQCRHRHKHLLSNTHAVTRMRHNVYISLLVLLLASQYDLLRRIVSGDLADLQRNIGGRPEVEPPGVGGSMRFILLPLKLSLLGNRLRMTADSACVASFTFPGNSQAHLISRAEANNNFAYARHTHYSHKTLKPFLSKHNYTTQVQMNRHPTDVCQIP